MDESISLPILVFRMGDVRTAFLLDAVVQVFDAVEVGDFPDSLPKDVLGVINVRGLKLPLVDIRRRWGLPGGSVHMSNQLVVVECEGLSLSVIVDEVIGTRSIPLKKVVRLADILPGKNPHMAYPDADGILILLDTDRLFPSEHFKEIHEWAEEAIG